MVQVGQTFRLWILASVLSCSKPDFTSSSFCSMAPGSESMLPILGKARKGTGSRPLVLAM